MFYCLTVTDTDSWSIWSLPSAAFNNMIELQDRNCELREEVRWHEAQQLNATAFAVADAKARRRLPTSVAQ